MRTVRTVGYGGGEPSRRYFAIEREAAKGGAMTAVELLARCGSLGIDLTASPNGTLLWESDTDPPAELMTALAQSKAAILALIQSPTAKCSRCGNFLDARDRCWRCCDRLCVDCGRWTGSAFIQRCVVCGNALVGD